MLLPLLLAFQTQVAMVPTNAVGAPTRPAAVARNVPLPTAVSATAMRAERPPVIDGRDEDEIWRTAPAITQFRQHDPVEDTTATLRTEARVAYDAKYLYVFVRAFDSRPDSIMAQLSRRDARTQSDYIHLMIDSYRDRRTGFRFTTNPLGVQRDIYISNDGNEDASWDGVWNVGTKVDSLGWTAEYRIPFGQLRFPEKDSHTFGFAIWRDVARSAERVSWPLYRRSKTGFVSQWGDVSGFDGIETPRRLEILPYSVTSNASRPDGSGGFGRHQSIAAGADIKYGLTSNLTLDATVNPDFGQVEADPSVLNLSAFEQFFQERRPFFLEGAGIFNFGDNIFYSRRIGRSPQLGGVYYDQDNPLNTTIMGATKLTGRLANGLSIGFLDAVTQRELGANGKTIEPQTNYLVARLQQDLRDGNSGIGMILTATNRALDDDAQDFLRENAYVVGVDARHRFFKNNYALYGRAIASRVSGSAAAIARTQRSAVHFYQRADGGFTLDTTATELDGHQTEFGIEKQGGGVLRLWSGFTNTSAGFEVNDAGFLPRADTREWGTWVGLLFNKPTDWYRRLQVNFNQYNNWNTGGQRLGAGGNINLNGQFHNQWSFWAGWNLNNVGATFDDRAARGGPAIRRPFRQNGFAGFEMDPRWKVIPTFQGFFNPKDEMGSESWGIDPYLSFRVSSRFQTNLGFSYNKNVFDWQWYNNVVGGDGQTHYLFARLDQTTSSLTGRFDITATPTLSLQIYAQPFVTSGDYSNLREIDDPHATTGAKRFKSYAAAEPQDFNFKQFRSNTVVRWEYRPGSALFFVWQQGREQFDRDLGTFQLGRDYGNLFKSRADNTFLVKASYWFSL